MLTANLSLHPRARHLLTRNRNRVRDCLKHVQNSAAYFEAGLIDRRRSRRRPVEFPMRVVPARVRGNYVFEVSDGAAEMLAMTRNLSAHGVGFAHDEPLQQHWAITIFDVWGGESIALVMRVKWSRRMRYRSYLTGGVFLGVVEEFASASV